LITTSARRGETSLAARATVSKARRYRGGAPGVC